MKKSLLALAVLAASGVAMAQSSVTLYGVADASLAKVTDKSTLLSTNGTMNNGNSRFGFKGVEDLGGGLKASFNFEASVNLGTGATDANVFQRNAFIALDGSFGQIYAGRRLSPLFYSMVTYELTGSANYSLVANVFGFGGNPAPRNSSFIAYTTPSISGLQATVGTTLKGNQTAPNGADTEFTMNYKQGPLALTAAYEQQAQTGGLGTKRYGSIGGAYDFGGFILATSYQDPSGPLKGFTIGGTMMFGVTSLTLDLARDTGSAKRSTSYLMELKQPLSKRTFAYVAMLRLGETTAAKASTGLGMGVRHNF